MTTQPTDRETAAPRGPTVRVGALRVSVAAFVCPFTGRLGRGELGFPVAAVAVATDVARHAARLSETLYGAWSPRAYEAWPLPFDEGLLIARDLVYRHLAFDARWMGGAVLPDGVALEDGCLRVTLPHGTSQTDLAGVLRSELTDLSLDRVARRPDQVRYRYGSSRPVVVPPRYALVTPGDVERVVVAEDLHRFRPRDLPRVAGALALGMERLVRAATAAGPV